MSTGGSTTTKRSSAKNAPRRPQSARAEQVAEDWGERLVGWMSGAVARTREELEDIWAEAQRVRRGRD